MKKCLCLFLSLLMCLIGLPAFASEGSGSLTVTIDGNTYTCSYDPSPQYSNYAEGSFGVSYYTYDADNTIYEFFLLIPDTATSGKVWSDSTPIDPGTVDFGIIYYRTTSDLVQSGGMISYTAGQITPPDAKFELRVDEAEITSGYCVMKGSFSCTMKLYQGQTETGESTMSGNFDFRMVFDSTNSPYGGATQSPSSPKTTPAPSSAPNMTDSPRSTPALPENTAVPYYLPLPTATDYPHKV